MTDLHPAIAEVRRYLAVGFPIVCVLTHEEERALELIQGLWPAAHLPLWTMTTGIDGDESLREPDKAISSMTNSGSSGAWVMLDLHWHLREPRVVRSLRDFVRSQGTAPKALVLIMPTAQIPPDLEKDVAVVDLALPDTSELRQLLDEVQTQMHVSCDDPEAWVLAARGLTRLEAARAFRMAVPDPEPLRRIIDEKQRALRSSSALELVHNDVRLDDVGGLEVLKGWLRSRLPAFRQEARGFGLPEPRGLLICGVQGCGKSLVAKAAASVFGLPLVRLDFASVFASHAPELSVRQAMRVAEAIAPVVLWVDEIEKGLAGSARDSAHARVFGDFLIWLQEKQQPVFVAATANEVENLPPELARRGRFDDVFFVDLPAAKERAEILSIHLRRRQRDPLSYDLEALTRGLEHFSGAELEQVVISALFRAFGSRRELRAEDLRAAANEIVPLATMYEQQVQAVRTWAQSRARRASADRRTLELFDD